MTFDVDVDIVIEVEQIGRDQPEWLRSEERRVGIFNATDGISTSQPFSLSLHRISPRLISSRRLSEVGK